MATPISKGGPLDPPEAPLRHPGFYTGDDPVEWAKNAAACHNFNADALAKSEWADKRTDQIALDRRNANMLLALVKRAR